MGLFYGFSAYVLWGFLPLYFAALKPAGAWEVLAWRIVLSLVVCVVLIVAMRQWAEFRHLLRDRRIVFLGAIAGVVIAINWGVFVYATQTGHVVDAALGYFLNPLVSALLGVTVLRETMRPLQWVALGFGGLAVVVLVVGYGSLPIIALALAGSFGSYGLIKKFMGPTPALHGLAIETLWITPLALLMLVWVGATEGLSIGAEGPVHTVLMSLAGLITTIPLLLFAGGARRLPLGTLGQLQYVNPILQGLVGVVLMGEQMPVERWFGFGLVWIALLIFSFDAARGSRNPKNPEK